MDIKAIILDFGGTLVEGQLDYVEYHRALRTYLASRGFNLKDRELQGALRASIMELNRVRDRGLELTFEEVYSDFLGRLGIPEDQGMLRDLHDIFKRHYKSHYYTCVEDVLKELSVRYKLGMISNTMSDQPHRLLKEAGYDRYFDVTICSRDLGIRKPNPKIFKYVLDRLDVKPHETVHVGDSVDSDMRGATSAGITGIWIKSSDQQPWTGHAISSICDLPEYLKRMEASG